MTGSRSEEARRFKDVGNDLRNSGRYEEAITWYQKAIQIDPDLKYIFNNLGIAYYNVKRHKDAIEAFDTCIGKYPDYMTVYYNKGRVLLELQNYQAAIACFDKVIQSGVKRLVPECKQFRAEAVLSLNAIRANQLKNGDRDKFHVPKAILFSLDTLLCNPDSVGIGDSGQWKKAVDGLKSLQPHLPTESLFSILKKNGIATGVITSAPRQYADAALRFLNITPDIILWNDNPVKEEHYINPFVQPCHDLDYSPSQCWAVCGSAEITYSARQAGCYTIGARWFSHESFLRLESRPDLIFNDFESFFHACLHYTSPFIRDDCYPPGSVISNPLLRKAALAGETIVLFPYHPKKDHGQDNVHHDFHSSRILNIKKINTQNEKGSYELSPIDERHILNFSDEIRSLLDTTYPCVICVIPSSNQKKEPTGIRLIAKTLCIPPIVDGTGVISRKLERPSFHMGGIRNPEEETASMEITDSKIILGRDVLLLDDVTTSGVSFRSAIKLLHDAGARSVICLALGRTWRDPI